jgi:cell division septal protein FtsQ
MSMAERYFQNVPIKKTHAPKRWGVWLLIPLLGGCIVLSVLAFKWRSTLTIQRVVVEGLRALTAQQIFSLASISLKSPMYETDLSAIQQRIAAHPFVSGVTITRRLPDALRIQIDERVPVASLNAGGMVYIDAERVALPVVQSSLKFDLPIISNVTGLGQMKFGEVVPSAELGEAIHILQTALDIDTSLYHFISEINMNSGGDVIMYSIDVGVPIMLGRGDVGRKLVTLQSFWTNFVRTQDAGKLKYIDLRYNDQVVVKWTQQTEHSSSKASL